MLGACYANKFTELQPETAACQQTCVASGQAAAPAAAADWAVALGLQSSNHRVK